MPGHGGGHGGGGGGGRGGHGGSHGSWGGGGHGGSHGSWGHGGWGGGWGGRGHGSWGHGGWGGGRRWGGRRVYIDSLIGDTYPWWYSYWPYYWNSYYQELTDAQLLALASDLESEAGLTVDPVLQRQLIKEASQIRAYVTQKYLYLA